jgi:hypothetical protein
MCSEVVRSRRPTRADRLLGVVALLLLGSGCGSHFVARGTNLYEDGHYVEAAEVFERTEQRLSTSSNSERARFGLYRGATFLKLGDVQHAARWLGYSRSVVNQDPEALGSGDAKLLDAALSAVGHVDSPAPDRSEHSELATAPHDVTGDAAVAQ